MILNFSKSFLQCEKKGKKASECLTMNSLIMESEEVFVIFNHAFYTYYITLDHNKTGAKSIVKRGFILNEEI